MCSTRALYFLFLVHFTECNETTNCIKNIPFSSYYVTSTNLLKGKSTSEFAARDFVIAFNFETDFDKTSYKIALRQKIINSVNLKTDFIIYGKSTEEYSDIENKSIDIVEGFIIKKENSSSVMGYIKHNCFYGTIFCDNHIYYIGDLKHFPHIYEDYKNTTLNAVVYKENSFQFDSFQNYDEAQLDIHNKSISYLKSNNEKELYRFLIGKGKVCTLFILLDNSFLKIYKYDVRLAVASILNSIEETNSLFRSTDFDEDGIPDNIGFMIKYFVILQSEESPMNFFPKYSSVAVDGKEYLNRFSQYKLLNEVCLGVAFTGHTFKNNVLGVSYAAEATDKVTFKYSIGGICDRPYKFGTEKNLNIIAISPRLNSGNHVPGYIFNLALAHELGHSFGSDHDISSTCIGHLMTAVAPTGNTRKSFLFSKCSKKLILKAIVSKGHCFENNEDAFCGNGIIESEETCDCGTVRNCLQLDACCIPRGQKNACKVNKQLGHECHPSQGMCCTTKCRYKDMSEFDLNCKYFDRTCPCKRNSTQCSCGTNGLCTGNTCSNEECARINLTECVCPEKYAYDRCKTCCSYNNSCLPSSVVTERLLNDNVISLAKLELIKSQIRSEKYGYYKTFCKNNSCVPLYFREVHENDYCLLYGRVGICNNNSRCVIPESTQVYPSYIIKNTGSKLFVIDKLYFVILVYQCFLNTYLK